MEHTPRNSRRFNPVEPCSLIPALLHPGLEWGVKVGAGDGGHRGGSSFSRYQIYDVAGVANPYMEVPLKTLRAVTKSNLGNIFLNPEKRARRLKEKIIDNR
jgi:hypothetical protein